MRSARSLRAPKSPPPIPGWSSELFAELAWQLFDLHIRRQEWRHREVESVEWLGVRLYRRRVSIDFTVPGMGTEEFPKYWDALSPLTGWAVIPLSMMRKGVLHDFDIADESKQSIPVLTRDQHEAVAVAALMTLATRAIKAAGGRRLHSTLVERLERLVRENNADRAKAMLRAFEEGTERASDEGTVSDWKTYSAQRHALLCDQDFLVLLRDLATRYLMCVYLRAAPRERRILKYGYEDQTREDIRPGFWKRRANALYSLAVNLGWLPRVTRVKTGDPSGTQSYHIEVAAPTELIIARADLTAKSNGRTKIERSDSLVRRVHFHVRDRDDLAAGEANPMELEVHFALEPRGFLLSVMLIALMTFLLLFAGFLWHLNGVALRPQDTAAVVVVALPGLLAALLFRSDEEKLVAASVAGLRLMVGMLVLASLAAAGLLALNIDATTRQNLWLIVVVIAGLPAFATTVAWQLSLYWYRVASPSWYARRSTTKSLRAEGTIDSGKIPRLRPWAMVKIGATLALIAALGVLGASRQTWPGWIPWPIPGWAWLMGLSVVAGSGALACLTGTLLAWWWRSSSTDIIR